MPLNVDVKRCVVFGGERGEGLQKTEKMAVFADDLLVVPETGQAPDEIHLEAGPLGRVPESLSLSEPRTIPVAPEPARAENIPRYVEGATFVTSDLEDPDLNERIAEECASRNILCNIIDVKELCNTWLMSVVDTPNMIAAFSTRGGCAFYAQRTRIELEDELEHRSRISRIFTDVRSDLREEQCTFCTLAIVYEDDEVRNALADEQWDRAAERARRRAADVPDDYHVRDHSVSGPSSS